MFVPRGAPPEMLTLVELVPAPPPEFVAEAPWSAPEFPVEFGFASTAPPGTPGFFPSGEIVPRAARFPAGEATGAGGPGVAAGAAEVWAGPVGDVSSAGAAGLISVWRGCVGCTGSVKILCRG